MAQKFTSSEEAATQLGISKERLNQLREAGKVRAYRDGANWKFRTEDIAKLEEDGIPALDGPPSDLSLDLDDDVSNSPSDLDLASEDNENLGDAAASDISLDDVDEPTVAGIDDDDSDALALDMDEGPPNISDSILLSEAELGGTRGRPPSTIIGKAELDLDADLDLSPPGRGNASDVKLAALSDDDDDLALDLPSPSGNFEGLEELEVDLEAESSRILSPDDVAKVRGAAAAQQASELSDLELAPSDSDPGRAMSDIGVGGEPASGVNLTGLSALELDDDDDDQVLGEGSDVTLSGESSGINIISPSDSGLALDEVSLDLSGVSAIGSSLDLGSGVGEEMSLGSMIVGEGMQAAKVGEDFQLTPLGEEGSEDEERDSSQVIALEEISEEATDEPFSVSTSESGMMREDFGMGLAAGAAPIGVVSASETPFSVWNVLGLGSCLMLLGLCGMMAFDLLRNIWSWDEVTTLNSSLLEVLNPFL
jgi:excisionase family DNA binding protein